MIFMDLETRSTSPLPKVGGRNYAQDASTSIMAAGWSFDDQMWVWVPEVKGLESVWEHCLPEQDLFDVEVKLVTIDQVKERLGPEYWVAHNADGFDRHVWKSVCGWEPLRWFDSLHWTRLLGLPGPLGALGEYLLGVGKHEGRDITMQLSKPRKAKRGPLFIPLTVANMPAVIQYLVMDVLMMRKTIETELLPLLPHIPQFERRVLVEDRVINNRGCVLDQKLSLALIDIELEMRAKRGETMADIMPAKLLEDRKGNSNWNKKTPDERARSFLRQPKSLRLWLEEDHEIILDDLRKDTVLDLLAEEGIPPIARQVLEGRLGECRISTAKLMRALDIVGNDGRLRDMLIYCGAQTTGRWAGTKMQLHNLPKPVDLDLDDAIKRIEGTYGNPEAKAALVKFLVASLEDSPFTVSDLLSSLLRLCIVSPRGKLLWIGDYASVEARGLPWLADDDEALRVFWDGKDAYIALAAKLFGKTYEEVDSASPKERKKMRNVGKIAVLACGYGMGPDKLDAFAMGMKINLADYDLTPKFVIEGWRDANPAIAGYRTGEFFEDRPTRKGGFWKDLEWAFKKAVKYGAKTFVGKLEVGRVNNSNYIMLPSRRKLWYRGARIEKLVPNWGGDPRDTLVYDGWRRGAMRPIVTYGGKLVENATQAACRDFMAFGLLRLRDAGLPVVAHVHDEAIAETHGTSEEFEAGLIAMSTCPSWGKGFPLEVEAFTSDRYRKDPPKTSRVARARNGEIL